MTKRIQPNERSGREAYPDIIDLPHHQSKKHPHMSLYDRAAQFSPFAALSGYDDMIAEESRETDVQKEQEIDKLNTKLGAISSALAAGDHPTLTFTVFVPDDRKAGGDYVEMSGTLKKVDMLNQAVILFGESKGHDTKINIGHIFDIHGELVDHLDDEIL